MMVITRAQRKALFHVYNRAPLVETEVGPIALGLQDNQMSYRRFRTFVTPYLDNSGCIMVRWCNMWLGIEADGYTHS